jgi:hypothetical protein
MPVLAPASEILSLRKPSLVFALRASLSAVQIRSRRIYAPPKESIQRKGGPDAAYPLRSSLLLGVAERGFLPLRQRAEFMPHPCGLLTRYIHVPRPSGAAHANRQSCRFVRSKAPVLGAAYGIKPSPNLYCVGWVEAIAETQLERLPASRASDFEQKSRNKKSRAPVISTWAAREEIGVFKIRNAMATSLKCIPLPKSLRLSADCSAIYSEGPELSGAECFAVCRFFLTA